MVTLPFPGQPVPMLCNSFSQEIFPNIQFKPPLMQLEAIASRPFVPLWSKTWPGGVISRLPLLSGPRGELSSP